MSPKEKCPKNLSRPLYCFALPDENIINAEVLLCAAVECFRCVVHHSAIFFLPRKIITLLDIRADHILVGQRPIDIFIHAMLEHRPTNTVLVFRGRQFGDCIAEHEGRFVIEKDEIGNSGNGNGSQSNLFCDQFSFKYNCLFLLFRCLLFVQCDELRNRQTAEK